MADTLIVSVSGLRGIVGESLTTEVAVRYAAAFAETLPPGPIVIGRDGRTSGPLLLAAIRDYLTGVGRDVIDCGVAATPTVGIVVRETTAAGGIQISASHNPAAYNGMKLFSRAGRVLSAAAGKKVLARFESLGGHEATQPLARAERTVRAFDGQAAHVKIVDD
ncbi:MAG: phosphoglucosamine mutase, partial [Planctomycetia bacterium]